MAKYIDFSELLKQDMKPALGVTEPGAIALAAANAYEAVGGRLQKISLELDTGLYKNAYACAIPGTKAFGIETAALLGILAGEPRLELQVLANVSEEDVEKAQELKQSNVVTTKLKEDAEGIYLDCKVITDQGWGRCLILNNHTNVVLLENDQNIIFKQKPQSGPRQGQSFKTGSVADFLQFTNEVPFEEIAFVLEAVQMNKRLGKAAEEAGMGLASALEELERQNTLAGDVFLRAQFLTAAAMDARMGGMPLPAMSISGSGSHGIIATMPIAAVAEAEKIGEEKLARAVVLSFLVNMFIKEYSGRLSAFCGCAIAAGTGASAGIVHLMGGGKKQIESAINNMAANITGMICDGGNYGCSLKAATAARAAVMSAFLAMADRTVPANAGIVGVTAEETMRNMGKIAAPGMQGTEKVIIEIIREKNE